LVRRPEKSRLARKACAAHVPGIGVGPPGGHLCQRVERQRAVEQRRVAVA